MSRSAPKKRSGREKWKDRLKQKCLERVRQQRAQILSAMRHRQAGAEVASTLSAIIAESSSAAATAAHPSAGNDMYSAHVAGSAGTTADVDEDFEMMMDDDHAAGSYVGGAGSAQSAQPAGDDGLESLTPAEHAELVSSMERALQEDLQLEEQLVLEQYETMWADDEANMQAQLETAMAAHFAQIDHQKSMLASASPLLPAPSPVMETAAGAAGAGAAEQAEQTLCPICKRNWLLTADGGRVILCNCGFRLDVKNDAVTLASLRHQLAAVYQSHRSRCACEPAFSLKERFGVSNLWAECAACGLCEVVI